MAVEAKITNSEEDPNLLVLKITETSKTEDNWYQGPWLRVFGPKALNLTRLVTRNTERVETRSYETVAKLSKDIDRERSWRMMAIIGGAILAVGGPALEILAGAESRSVAGIGNPDAIAAYAEALVEVGTAAIGVGIGIITGRGRHKWGAAQTIFERTRFSANGLIEVPEAVTAVEEPERIQTEPLITPSITPVQA